MPLTDLAIGRDIGNAGIEHAALAGERLKDEIGDAMRTGSQAVLRGRHVVADHLLAAINIHEMEADVVTAAVDARDFANDQVVDVRRPPVLELHVLGPTGSGEHPVLGEGFEQATAFQVGLDHLGDIHGQPTIRFKRHHGNRQGTRHPFVDDDIEFGMSQRRVEQQTGG